MSDWEWCKVGLVLCDCLLVLLLAGSDCQWHSKKLYFPYIPTCFGGFSAVWAVKCEMWMTSWDWKQNEGCQSSAVFDLVKKDKRLQTGQNNVCRTEHQESLFLGAFTDFELRMTLKIKHFLCVILYCLSDLLFYLQLFVVMKTNDALHM